MSRLKTLPEGLSFYKLWQSPSGPPRKPEAKPEPKLTRVAFRVSRLMEFCSERELQNQTGHSVYDWPLVVGKELIDNALDACEEAEVAPEITVIVEKDTIVVQDNAGGIDAETIESVLDYTIRVSSREAYVSPTRGAQGNALKTILAMGYVLDRRDGDGDAGGRDDHREPRRRAPHRVPGRSRQQPAEDRPHDRAVSGRGRNQVHRPLAARRSAAASYAADSVQASSSGLRLVQSAPHGARDLVRPRVHQREGDQSRLGEVAAAQSDQRPLVRRSPAAALSRRACGERPRPRAAPHGARVRRRVPRALRHRRSAQDPDRGRLLASIAGELLRRRPGQSRRRRQAPRGDEETTASRSRPSISASSAPSISKQRFLAAGGNRRHLQVSTPQRRDATAFPMSSSSPSGCIKPACAGQRRARHGRRWPSVIAATFVTGANWSAAIDNPFRRFGSTGEGLENTLAKVRANASQPVICALHLASARIQFADRGKSSIILTDDAEQPDD